MILFNYTVKNIALDREKHKQYIISRMFNFGDDQAIEWVRNEYTDAEIDVLKKKGHAVCNCSEPSKIS